MIIIRRHRWETVLSALRVEAVGKGGTMPQYILDGHTPVLCEDIMEWGKRFEIENRIVKATIIKNVRVSTVFLGIDHNWGEGKPILFETMIFGGKHDQYQRRYSTWDESEAGHKEAVKMVKGKQ